MRPSDYGRTRRGAPTGALLVVLLLVAGCGGGTAGEQTAEQPAPSGSADAAGGRETAAEGEAFRVAILTPGSVNDNGYNADAQRSADLITDELGAEVSLTESVPVPNQADVYRQFASQGYDLVVGWGGQFTDGAVMVAEEFPDVNFLVVNSGASNGTNLASLDTAIEDWQFLAGWLQATLSESGVVGWVGAQCFPATAANLHGTEQGARYANPDIDFRSTFTGDFEDPTAASQGAQAMIEAGADVLSGNLNNGWTGVYEAAGSGEGVQVVTEWTDNHEVAPEVIVSSVLKSQATFVVEVVRSVQDSSFQGEFVSQPLPEDWGPVLADTELLPDDVYEQALEVQDQIASGEIEVEHDETCPS